ncbi:MAG TPA: hypothetical protein P5315_07830 [Clostridia bacterium]|nr:hypothetical protein [Clostridia bacterium]
MIRKILAVAFSGIWITISEFVRNEFLFKGYWTDHYNELGMSFETKALNGIFWFVWSIILAFIIMKVYEKFNFIQTLYITWLPAFLMMWITVYNLQVLPMKLLWFALPLSIVEITVALFIINAFERRPLRGKKNIQ